MSAEILSEQEPVGSGLVAFDYIKTNDFRTVWVDGAIGGLTPSGSLGSSVGAFAVNPTNAATAVAPADSVAELDGTSST